MLYLEIIAVFLRSIQNT